ncbi:MAG: sugar phosphate isomerase/epimerase family protein [Tepidisphaeraceae bacterium]
MPTMAGNTISFISANYVARALNYTGKSINEWGKHDAATVEACGKSSEHFMAVARDVSDAGFDAIDVWSAHCHWQKHDRDDYLEQVKGICSNFDLSITSYAGGIWAESLEEIDKPFRFMKQLGAPILAGGAGGKPPYDQLLDKIDEACRKYGVRFAYENHPEKTPADILAKAGEGKYPKSIGVALDTGWCGTQGLDAVEAVKQVRERLFILHLKDVEAAGGHETCALGEGVVNCEGVVRYLVDSGWEGTIGIEHEPFNRDPMPEVKTSFKRLKAWLK